MEKTTKKTYSPSDNLKLIVKAIGQERKATIEDLKVATNKSSNCLIATASASNNKAYINYVSKSKVQQIDGSIVEEKAHITLTDKGYALLLELEENK